MSLNMTSGKLWDSLPIQTASLRHVLT
jgi:hypothetical protein